MLEDSGKQGAVGGGASVQEKILGTLPVASPAKAVMMGIGDGKGKTMKKDDVMKEKELGGETW